MALPKQKIVVRPESELKLTDFAKKILKEADALGVLPTPLDRLLELSKITSIEDLPDESFLENLSARAREVFRSAKQKIRGIADLRERAVYVPRDTNSKRQFFAKAHELSHHVIPWHDIDPAYLDDSETLSPDAKAIFEREANFLGSEFIFQGDVFCNLARSYQPSFQAIFVLSDQHAASRQSTAWRYVEEQDEPVALVQYYPSNAIDDYGNCVLNVWRAVGSPEFIRRFTEIEVPQVLRTGHAWVAARDLGHACDGMDNLLVDGDEKGFQWFAWWNGSALLVLLRRKPKLSVISSLLRS